MTITFLLPEKDHDPSESGIIWQALVDNGFDVQFATPNGQPGYADERMVSKGFGLLSPVLMTQKSALTCYHKMITSPAFKQPLSYQQVQIDKSQGIFVPGGHAKGMKSLLESAAAQQIVVAAFKNDLPVGAVCHGVVLLARSVDPDSGKSVLYGKKTTALIRSMELSAWALTWLWLKNYYRTYPESVATEVKKALARDKDFKKGPVLPMRDSQHNIARGFTVSDGNYLSARWPGDCHRLAHDFVALLKRRQQIDN
jgi:putative intracellular protease/amidase